MQFYFLFAVIYMYYIRRLAVESAGKLCRAVRCPVTADGLTVSDIHGNVRFTPAAVGIIENIAGADLRFRNLRSQVDKALGLEDSVCNASSSKVRQPLKPACSTAASATSVHLCFSPTIDITALTAGFDISYSNAFVVSVFVVFSGFFTVVCALFSVVGAGLEVCASVCLSADSVVFGAASVDSDEAFVVSGAAVSSEPAKILPFSVSVTLGLFCAGFWAQAVKADSIKMQTAAAIIRFFSSYRLRLF